MSVARRDHRGSLALSESSRGYCRSWYDAEITRNRQWKQRITEDLPDASKMYDWNIYIYDSQFYLVELMIFHLPRKQCLINWERHHTWLAKERTAIDRLSVIWKSDLTDKIKCSFFQTVVVSILLYGCTTWILIKHMEKKLDSNYIRMLRPVLNKSRRQHHTKQQLYGYLLPIMKTIKVRRTRHAGHC